MNASSCVLRSCWLVNVPRRSSRRERIENQSSIWLSQEAGVGGKWNRQRGCLEPGDDLGGLVHLEVVEDRVHLPVGGDLCLELIEEVDELGAAVAVVDVGDDLAAMHEQRREERLHSVAFGLELAPG